MNPFPASIEEGMNMKKHDCTDDVMEHKRKVLHWMNDFAQSLIRQAELHDQSKLRPPEKEVFDAFTPLLSSLEFGSDDYEEALSRMGEGLRHHYLVSRHHPEHFENGVNGMTLHDVIEMFCDWLAAAQAKNHRVDIDCLAKRFDIHPQLAEIFTNTVRYMNL